MVVGFSTGSLALGDFRLGLKLVDEQKMVALELSALRDTELPRLINALDDLNLSQFSYVSVHAPSRFETLTENDVVELLAPVFDRQWPVVVHPDVIVDFDLWQRHGKLVCIENMDKRKPIGRTASELVSVFEKLPSATLCFDIAHAHQIDPTMHEARMILEMHGKRLQQVHMSSVDSASKHEPLNYPSILGYRNIAPLIPPEVPIILESPVTMKNIEVELERAQSIFR